MRKLRITIENKSYEVTVEDLTESEGYPGATPVARPNPHSAAPVAAPAEKPVKPDLPIDSGAVTCPMAGSIKSILVKVGDTVKQNQPLVILEAMKMENQITAPVAGTVNSMDIAEGDNVREGHVLLVLE